MTHDYQRDDALIVECFKMIDYILGREAKHEVFCKKCDEYVGYNSISGHVHCGKCRELLGFLLGMSGVIFTWESQESDVKAGIHICVPQKQRWTIHM